MPLSDFGLQLAAAATVPLLPFVWKQGRRVRDELPRLPEAAGPCTGVVNKPGLPVRLLLVGESTAAGVGVANHAQGLVGQTARTLARLTERPVQWRAHGRRGITAQAAHDGLLPTLPKAPWHIVVIALGVNDVVRLRSPARWRRDVGRLVAGVRARTGHPPVLLAGVPPIGQFPALPEPLRTVLGWRGQLLDQATRHLTAETQTMTHVPAPRPERPESFSSDGFHPGPDGYALWGAQLGRAAAKIVQGRTR